MGVLIKTNSIALQRVDYGSKCYQLNFSVRCLLENEELILYTKISHGEKDLGDFLKAFPILIEKAFLFYKS